MNLIVDMLRLSYTELMLIWNSDVDPAGICVRIVLLIVYLSNSAMSNQTAYRAKYHVTVSTRAAHWMLY